MYLYIPMDSMTVVVDKYTLSIEGLESRTRIPCLDALLGTMLVLKATTTDTKTPLVEPVVEPVIEPPVMEAPIMA